MKEHMNSGNDASGIGQAENHACDDISDNAHSSTSVNSSRIDQEEARNRNDAISSSEHNEPFNKTDFV